MVYDITPIIMPIINRNISDTKKSIDIVTHNAMKEQANNILIIGRISSENVMPICFFAI